MGRDEDNVMKVVILDDNPDTSFFIDVLLKRHGYWVSVWNKPSEAMAESEVETWVEADLAVVDYDLRRGQVTGVDVLRWAREEAGFTGRSLLITASPAFVDDDNEEMVERYVDLVLSKVFEVDEFLDTIKRLVGE